MKVRSARMADNGLGVFEVTLEVALDNVADALAFLRAATSLNMTEAVRPQEAIAAARQEVIAEVRAVADAKVEKLPDDATPVPGEMPEPANLATVRATRAKREAAPAADVIDAGARKPAPAAPATPKAEKPAPAAKKSTLPQAVLDAPRLKEVVAYYLDQGLDPAGVWKAVKDHVAEIPALAATVNPEERVMRVAATYYEDKE